MADETSDYWAEFEGIPLCHVAKDADDTEALGRKGVCGPSC